MKGEEVLKVTNEELRKLKVIESVIEKKMKRKKAAELLGLSVRQVIRLVKRVRKEGSSGIVHKLRGRASNRKHEESFKEKILRQCLKRYEGFGPTLAQEKLEELDKLVVNRETLRQWMMEGKLWERQRKGKQHREWRERRACFGEMIQVDGSHHDWLEGRGPGLVLMGYIDDATSEVFAWFYDYEGTMPALDSFDRYSKRYGLPHSIYIDRLAAYHGYGKLTLEEELAGKEKVLSQFERALEELGVEVIHAQSAPAKGRIERLFKTFQDRLIKEMRLAGAKTKEEANRVVERYLPKFNRRFGVKARESGNLHRPRLGAKRMKRILSIQTKRALRNDNTIRHENRFYLLQHSWKGSRPKELRVEERLDGKLYVMESERELRYREVVEPPGRTAKRPRAPRKPRKTWHPPNDHPWRAPLRAERMQKAA